MDVKSRRQVPWDKVHPVKIHQIMIRLLLAEYDGNTFDKKVQANYLL